MILNKYGSFVAGRNKIRVIPYRHHLDNNAWMVTIIAGQVDPLFYRYAVWGGDNAQAAENAYGCYLAEREDVKRLKDAPMRELDEGRMKLSKKHKNYINVEEK